MPFWISPWTLSNCVREATGPIAELSDGSPTLTPSAVARAAAAASSSRVFGTSMRDGALQLWPELAIITATPAATLCAKASSSSTMFGLLPPSSWATRLTVVRRCGPPRCRRASIR